jgi:uncharacterized protein
MTVNVPLRLAAAFLICLPLEMLAQHQCRPDPLGSLSRSVDSAHLVELQKRAESGDLAAQMAVGTAYEYRKDNIQEAARFYAMAARSGLKEAQAQLAYIEYSDLNDPAEAARWNRKAAEQGCVDAQLSLSDAYMHGDGVDKDVVEGVRLLRQSAESGYVAAQANLGDTLLYDKQVAHDPAEALRWYTKAAEQGSSRGQYGAGFVNGFGSELTPPFPEDYVAAYTWFSIASENGAPSAKIHLTQLAPKMTSDEIARANHRKESWIAAHKAVMNQKP